MTEEFTPDNRPSGITEHLRRWGWKLPEGYEPIRLEDCHCRELVLVISGDGKTLKVNRDGRLHRLHPRTSGVGEQAVPLDEVRDMPVRIIKLGEG